MKRIDANSSELLVGLFDSAVTGASSDLKWNAEALAPAEQTLVAHAVESRRREFATGRMLVRQLLEARGVRNFPLLRDDDRVPVWPEGIVGSISHTKNLAVAVIASDDDFCGLGIDVEPDAAVESGIERMICREPELEWVGGGSEEERGTRCRIVFSIKEAVYKAFFPRIRTFWKFQDVEVEIDLEAERFVATLPTSARRDSIEGRVVRRAGWILSAAEIRNDP